MARAIVNVGGRTSRPSAPVTSLVDRPFLVPMLVRKTSGTGAGVEKAALVVVDNQYMVVAPTRTGEPAKYVGRRNADKHYTFVRYLNESESIAFAGKTATEISQATAAAARRR